MANNAEKKTKGRQRVALARMEKESNRLVTFSKRRVGLFKKISELCILCGAEAAVIVFSPGRKAFSFGHPSVDATLNRFLFADSDLNSNMFHAQTVKTHEDESIVRSNIKITIVHDHFELEKKRYENFMIERKLRKEDFEWLIQAQELGGENLDKIQGLISHLKNTVCHLYREFVMEINNANGLLFTGLNVSEPAYQFSQGLVGGQCPPYTLVDGPNASKAAYQFSQGMLGGQNPPSCVSDGQPHQPQLQSNLVGGPSNHQIATMAPTSCVGGSGNDGQSQPQPQFQPHQIAPMVPPNLVGSPKNHQITTMASTNLIGGCSNYQISTMAPTSLVGGPSDYDHPQMMTMNQTLMRTGFGDPSLTRGSNDMAIDHLGVNDNMNANTVANVNVNPLSSLPNSLGFGFPNPNLLPSFQGENNLGVGEFDGLSPLPLMNMDINPMSVDFQTNPMPANFQTNPMSVSFNHFPSSSQAEMNSMDNPTAPYNLQNGFGFGNDKFY